MATCVRASALAAAVWLTLLGGPGLAQETAGRPEEARREAWLNVPGIVDALGIVAGAAVADVGAGDGFFTVRLARAVGPNGRVYAVDVTSSILEKLRKRVSD
jgi:predicted methyltransferase